MTKKKITALVLATAMSLSTGAMVACSDGKTPEGTTGQYSMDITKQVSEWKKVSRNNVTFYSAEGVAYCEKPTTKAKQSLNIYIPAEYMNDDGTINSSGTCNGYTAATAPIMYINSVGGYMGKAPYKISETSITSLKEGWCYNYLKEGFVLAFAGARGRVDFESSTKKALGKAPVSLADLKAGIRFLKANDNVMPGDANKIISNGMSAGGAMSILLGVSGNSSEFDSYLEEMGAVMNTTDDVYAAQVYCPITNLEYADFAYEWMFCNDNSATAQQIFNNNAFVQALSDTFYDEYIKYFNSLNLTVDGTTYSIDSDGRSGTFVEWLLEQYQESYKIYAQETGETAPAPDYISSLDGIVQNINHRSKVCPSFDRLDITDSSAAENGVFGNPQSTIDAADYQRHFSVPVTEIIKSMESSFPTEYAEYYNAYKADSDLEQVKKQVSLYNPYTYLSAGNTDVAKHIRINVGTADSDTSPSISAQLALTLMSLGIDTEYNLIWGFGHTDADYANAYETWVNGISK